MSEDKKKATCLILPSKVIIGSKKKHTVAFLPLTHGDAWAIPKSLCYLRSFVIIMPTRA